MRPRFPFAKPFLREPHNLTQTRHPNPSTNAQREFKTQHTTPPPRPLSPLCFCRYLKHFEGEECPFPESPGHPRGEERAPPGAGGGAVAEACPRGGGRAEAAAAAAAGPRRGASAPGPTKAGAAPCRRALGRGVPDAGRGRVPRGNTATQGRRAAAPGRGEGRLRGLGR